MLALQLYDSAVRVSGTCQLCTNSLCNTLQESYIRDLPARKYKQNFRAKWKILQRDLEAGKGQRL